MTSPTSGKGQPLRLKLELPVLLWVAGRQDKCLTVECALSGLFLATERTHPLRQLVRLQVGLPEGEKLEFQGMIVRVVDTAKAARLATVPGVGVQFYGQAEETLAKWTDYLESGPGEPMAATRYRPPRPTPNTDADAPMIPIESGGTLMGHKGPERVPVAGHSVEEVARAAGLDPRIVAAALASDEGARTLHDAVAEADTLDEPSEIPGMLRDSESRPIHIIGTAQGTDGADTGEARELKREWTEAERPSAHALDEAEPKETMKFPPGVAAMAASNQQESSGAPDVEAGGEDAPAGPDDTIRTDVGSGSGTALADALDSISEELPPLSDPFEGPPEDEPPEEDEEDRKPTQAMVPAEPAPIVPHEPEKPSYAPLAPTGFLPHVVYRLVMTSVGGLEKFSHTALTAGGVFVRTPVLRPVGTPSVVCVVHPQSQVEFHIPGVVEHTRNERPGVGVRFVGLTPRTLRDFRQFIALGDGPAAATEVGREDDRSQELAMFNDTSQKCGVGVIKTVPKDTHSVKMSEVEPYRQSKS